MPDRSRIAAISTNIGTETNTNELTKLKIRLVISGTELGPNQPSAKISATSSDTKASGIPVSRSRISAANIAAVAHSMPQDLKSGRTSATPCIRMCSRSISRAAARS